MSTNITTDNYEAYLLDYMEGNLNPDEAEQLKAFVAAQGLDWNELTEELPHLEAPQIEFDNKERLMQRSLSLYKSRSLSLSKGRTSEEKRTIIPLYVKIASVAAAAGLLLTVSLWPEKSMPKVEPIASLKPIEVSSISTNEPFALLPRRAIESVSSPQKPMRSQGAMPSTTSTKGHVVSEREATPLLAELPTKTATALQTEQPWTDFNEPDFGLLAYRMDKELAMMSLDGNDFYDDAKDERDLSLIGKGIYLLTDGRYDSFEDLIFSGLTTAKKELSLAATDMALAAYSNVNEQFEEAKERWEEKHGE